MDTLSDLNRVLTGLSFIFRSADNDCCGRDEAGLGAGPGEAKM